VAYTWGPLFTRIVQSVQDGTWQSEHIRGGIESDFLTLAAYGPAVDAETQQQIEDAKAKLVSGELQIFAGPLKDNTGAERIAAGAAGGIELLDTTDWLVEGVIGQTN
jgi:basic membrane protein A